MLQIMREMTKSWIFKGLFFLLAISFGIWGVGDMFRGNPQQREVARAGKISIPVGMLESRFQRDMPEARQVFGADLTVEQARKIGVLDRTLNVMIEEILFDQEAKRLGLSVGDDVIMRRLAQEPKLRDKDGRFNTQLWHQVLGKGGMNERFFLDHETQQTARQFIIHTVMPNAKAPQIMIDSLYQARGAKRILDVVTLSHNSIKESMPPDAATLEAFYKEHEQDFVAPEYRGLTIAELSSDAVKEDVSITEEDLKTAYESRKAELTEPESRDLLQVVLQDEAKAQELAKQAQTARDLAKAAKAKGLTPIAMKKINEKNVLPELYTSVFSLEKDQIVGPVKSSLGWHIVQVQAIHSGGLPPFETVKDSLRTTLKEERIGDHLARLVNQWDDGLAGGRPLEELADSLKLRLSRFAAIDAEGKAPDGKEVADIPAKDITLPSGFELNSGETGQVIEDGKGHYYAVRVDQVTASQPRPLSEIKDVVQNIWIKKQQKERAMKAAEDMAKALREGQKPASFATQTGVSIRLSKPISMLGDMDPDLPPAALSRILMMKKDDVITADGADRQYILKLSQIVPVDLKKPDASRLKVADYLAEKLPHSLVEQYSIYLHKILPVKIDTQLLTNLKSRSAEE